MNNTRELRRQIAKELSESEMWLTLRLDKKGNVHLQTPEEEGITLIALLLGGNTELRELINGLIEDLSKI